MSPRIAGLATKSLTEAQIENALEANPMLRESYESAAASILMLRTDDYGYKPLNLLGEEDGFSLQSLHQIGDHAKLQVTGNPLLKRGRTLRTSNVFGKGVTFESPNGTPVQARYRAIMDKPGNKTVLFSQDAFARNEGSAFMRGNLIMAYRKSTKTFFPVPFRQITNSVSNPDLRQDVWFYQRSYNPVDNTGITPMLGQQVIEWYPVLEYTEIGKALPTRIGMYPVDSDVVVVDFKVNTDIGGIYGIPDCLPAMPYAWAHAEYIRDASKLLKALSTIAWKVVARSKSNAINAGAKLGGPMYQGSTATMTDGTDLVALPRAGQVDMADGQAIAAYVASALEVSLIALLSDPGTATGSYGAAATLDGPSANSARARQGMWVDFYERIYRVIGCSDIVVNFPKISEDPAFRAAQTLTLGFASGAIQQDEYRRAFLEVADVVSMHTDVPQANIFTNAAQFSLEAVAQAEQVQQAASDAAISQAKASNVTGQGASTGVGKQSDGNNSTRDQGSAAGRKPNP